MFCTCESGVNVGFVIRVQLSSRLFGKGHPEMSKKFRKKSGCQDQVTIYTRLMGNKCRISKLVLKMKRLSKH